MPYYDRLRSRFTGAGFGGSKTTWVRHIDIPGQYVSWTDSYGPQPAFTVGEVCLDSAYSHYDDVGRELWHDFYLDKLELRSMPLIVGTVYTSPGVDDQERTEYSTFPFLDEWANGALFQQSVQLAGQPVPSEEWSEHPFRPYSGELDDPITHMDLTTLLSPTDALLAKIHPLAKQVDIPSFLIETFKDLPSLVLLRGNTLLGTVGNVNLSYQFGWKPTIADLKDLLRLGESVQKRIRTLDAMRSDGITTRGILEQHTDSQSSSVEFAIDQQIFYGSVSKTTSLKRWGCVNYAIPADYAESLLHMDADEKQWYAIQTLTGLYWNNPAALWELIPWSWLVDWFANVQQKLERFRPGMELIPQRYAIMTETKTDFSFTATGSEYPQGLNLSALSFSGIRTTKQRVVSNETENLPSVPDAWPYLDERRIGIIGSLIAQLLK